MSKKIARRRAAQAVKSLDSASAGSHVDGVECPDAITFENGPTGKTHIQCSECWNQWCLHMAWLATGSVEPWADDQRHDPKSCFKCCQT